MRYYITIQRKLFGLIPWTSVKKARNPEHAAKMLGDMVGVKVKPIDLHLFLRKELHIHGTKTVTLHQ